jgi:Flp pilus assembly protein TadG
VKNYIIICDQEMSETMRPLLRRSSNREGAQGMVEFALVLPLLLMLMFGLIEVGRMLFVYSMVSSSSREGARYGAAAGDVGGFVTHYEDCDGIRAAAERIGNFAGVSDGDISITYDRMDDSGNATTFASCNSGLTYDCEPNCGDSPYQKVKLGDRVIVSVSREFQPILPLVNLPSFPISSETYRTIVKDVQIEGTPQPAAANSPTVDFVPATQTVTEGDSAVKRAHRYGRGGQLYR